MLHWYHRGLLGFSCLALFLICTSAFSINHQPKEIFKLCGSCHGMKGEGQEYVAAPAIAGLPAWYIETQLTKFKNGARGANPHDTAGLRMRPMSRTLRSDEDLKGIAEFVSKMDPIATPQTLEGSWVRGEGNYQLCSTCHGPNGEGSQPLGAPPLVNLNDWYMYTQLNHFKNKIRGYDPVNDALGVAMGGMAATLDEQGMKDVIAYIKTLK